MIHQSHFWVNTQNTLNSGGYGQWQGAVAAGAQEGLEALSHVEGQEGWR